MVQLIAANPVLGNPLSGSPVFGSSVTAAGSAGRALRLSDSALIARCLPAGPFVPSEFCFANLWLFRARHEYRFVDSPVPHIRGVTYDGASHAVLLEPPALDIAAAIFAQGADCLYPFGEDGPEWARRLGLRASCVDADSDYWYRGGDLATLAHAKKRRSQARSYALDQAPVFHPWRADLADQAQAVLRGWADDVARPALKTDFAACREAIEQADELRLEGGLVTAGGTPVAFLLASRSGTARVVHFAKGRRAHSAAYPWMFARYAALSGAEWLNFEQDLGNAGLALSKRAYAPKARQAKYRLHKSLPF